MISFLHTYCTLLTSTDLIVTVPLCDWVEAELLDTAGLTRSLGQDTGHRFVFCLAEGDGVILLRQVSGPG